MKAAVVGSRSITNFEIVSKVLDKIFLDYEINTIISGGAKGVDTLAELYANKNNIPFIKILPDWDKHGIQAGVLRNTEIVDKCDILVAFWDGISKGTLDSINKATKKGKEVFTIKTESTTQEEIRVEDGSSMKLSKIIQEVILSEIGDLKNITPYEYKLDNIEQRETFLPRRYHYTFELDDQPDFVGKIELAYNSSEIPDKDFAHLLEMTFNVIAKTRAHYVQPGYTATDLGVKTVNKVLSTVIKVLKEDLLPRIKDLGEDEKITSLGFFPVKTKASNINWGGGSRQRAMLYDSLIRKNFNVKNKRTLMDLTIYDLKEPL